MQHQIKHAGEYGCSRNADKKADETRLGFQLFMSPEFANHASNANLLSRELERQDDRLDKMEDRFNSLAKAWNDQREKMTGIGLLLHDLGILKNSTLERLENQMDNIVARYTDAVVERLETALELKAERGARDHTFAALAPSVARELENRQERGREAREYRQERQHERAGLEL